MRHFLMIIFAYLLSANMAFAGNQKEEQLSISVKALMQKTISDLGAPKLIFANQVEGQAWMAEMSARLKKRLPDQTYREEFLRTVHYEATRAGLDTQMVMGLIHVESGFKKYAVSSVGARGYMQVMPFWVKSIGTPDQNLFNLRLNLRYGCTILRHYVDIERGDLYRALGRYNGSLGKPQYPNLVLGAWRKHWDYTAPVMQAIQPATPQAAAQEAFK